MEKLMNKKGVKYRKQIYSRHKSYLLLITLNSNRLNTTIKRQKLEEWIKKHDPIICGLQETCFGFKDTIKLVKIKRMKKAYHENSNPDRVDILI